MARAAGFWFIAVLLGYLLSFALLAVSASQRWAWVVVAAGAACLVATSVVLTLMLQRRGGHPMAARHIVVPVIMLVAGGVLVWLWLDSTRPGGVLSSRQTGGWGFFGACLALMGAGHVLTAVRYDRRWTLVRGAALAAGCGAAFLVSLFVVGDGAGWAVWAMAAGVLLAPVAMGLLTEDVAEHLVGNDRRPWRPGGLALLAVGVAGAGLGIWLLVAAAGFGYPFAVLVPLVLVGLVGAIASNTPTDAVVVAAVLALVWSNVPRGVAPDPLVIPEPGQPVLVALGDSFMSGEGAKRFYQGTNDLGRNECRRAPTAFPAVTVASENPYIPDHLAFVACSGARAIDITRRAQQPADPADRPEGGLPQLAHVEWLQANTELDVDLVIVSIGGNDARFGEIAEACVAPGDCTEIGTRWLDNLQLVAPRVHQTYQNIRDFFGPTVPVLVVPYPVPLNPSKCSSSLLTAQEHRFLHGYTIELDSVLERAASDAGLHYLREMTDVFEAEHLRICDNATGKVGVNFLAMSSVGGLAEQTFNPQNWFRNSLHPNERGHRAMAETLERWFAERPDLVAPSDPPPSDEQDTERIRSIESIMGDPAFRHCGSDPTIPHCGAATLDWTRAQVVALGRRGVGPLLLTIAGLWIVWLWLIWWWRGRRATPRPLGPVSQPKRPEM